MSNNIFLNSLAVDITNRCNLRCKHCYNYSGEQKIDRTEWTPEELELLTQQINEARPSHVCICGGEPMIRKDDVYGFIRRIRPIVKSINMVSNGYFIGSEEAMRLKETGIDLVQISIDGLKDSHNWLRGNECSYDRAINAIHELTNEGIRVSVACAPNIHNIEQLEDLIMLMENSGAYMLRMQPMMMLGRANENAGMVLGKKEYIRLARKINNLMFDGGYKMKIEWGDPTEHLFSMSRGITQIEHLSINPYGDLMISPYVPISFGNVKIHSLEEYLEAGVLNVVLNPTIEMICSLIKNSGNMDLSRLTKMPELYQDEMIMLDCMRTDFKEKCDTLKKEVIEG